MNVNVSDLTPDQVRNVVSQLVRTNPDAVAEATGATLGVGSAVAVYDAEAAAADAVMGTQVPGTDPHHHQGPVSVSAAALGFPPAPPAVEEPWNRYETGVAPTVSVLRACVRVRLLLLQSVFISAFIFVKPIAAHLTLFFYTPPPHRPLLNPGARSNRLSVAFPQPPWPGRPQRGAEGSRPADGASPGRRQAAPPGRVSGRSLHE